MPQRIIDIFPPRTSGPPVGGEPAPVSVPSLSPVRGEVPNRARGRKAAQKKGGGFFQKFKVKGRRLRLPKISRKELVLSLPKEGLVVLTIILLGAAVAVYFNFAAIKIEVWPASQTVHLQEDIVADTALTQIDFVRKALPAKVIEEEKTISRQFSVSGTVWQEKKAQGVIRVYNNYNLAQVLVEKTRFLSADDKLFYAKEKVSIPAGAWLDVGVEAAEAGPEYNINPTAFSIPGLAGSPRYAAVYGKSLHQMQDGWRGKVGQVTKDDLDKAKETLTSDLRAELKQILEAKASGDFVLLGKAVAEEVIDASSLATIGTRVDQFNFKVKMKLKALVFESRALRDLTEGLILKTAGEGKKVDGKSLEIHNEAKAVDFEVQTLTLAADFSAKVYADVDVASLKAELKGKSFTEAASFLKNNPRLERIKIKFWPFWKKNMPLDEGKIKIEIKKS